MQLINILVMKIENHMGGPVSSAIVEIAIPLHIEPSSFIVSKRDITGKFKDIQEISFE